MVKMNLLAPAAPPEVAPTPLLNHDCHPRCDCIHNHRHISHMKGLSVIGGLLQRILEVLEEANGMPKGDLYTIIQPSPTQNQDYKGSAVANASVLRSLTITGPGNVTLSIIAPHVVGPVGSANEQVLLQHNFNNTTIPFNNLRIRIPANSQLAIKTDASGSTNLLSLTAMVEPARLSGQQQYYGER